MQHHAWLTCGLLAFTVCSASGCTRGFLYTDITSPLVTNMKRTMVGTTSAKLSSKQVTMPLVQGSLSALWNSRAIGDAAKQQGITTIYSADKRTVSVLGGVWEKQTVIVYGD